MSSRHYSRWKDVVGILGSLVALAALLQIPIGKPSSMIAHIEGQYFIEGCIDGMVAK
jgi:hypothetical protein